MSFASRLICASVVGLLQSCAPSQKHEILNNNVIESVLKTGIPPYPSSSTYRIVGGDELKKLLPGNMLVPIQRIAGRWDECNEYFLRSGGWLKCSNPAGVIPEPFVSKEVTYFQNGFCVNVTTFGYWRCTKLFIINKTKFKLRHFYSNKTLAPSIIEVKIEASPL